MYINYILRILNVYWAVQNKIILSIYIKAFSWYKMLFNEHSKYDQADEVIELITYVTGEGII